MATFAEIKEVRLRIDDPPGMIDILEAGSFPSAPMPQTAYKISDIYYSSEPLSEAVEANYERLTLYVSDSRIGAWFDADGEDYACVQALKNIIARLGRMLKIRKEDTGAEGTEWNSLKETHEYYRNLLASFQADYDDSKSQAGPVWGASSTPEIAGGNL